MELVSGGHDKHDWWWYRRHRHDHGHDHDRRRQPPLPPRRGPTPERSGLPRQGHGATAGMKEFRAIATRYDKTGTSFQATIYLAAAVIASR
ncbi:protein of unknown function [Rhodovastum atsumiense]|nr:protein of unknown function [Rhodovastum atsumiense]